MQNQRTILKGQEIKTFLHKEFYSDVVKSIDKINRSDSKPIFEITYIQNSSNKFHVSENPIIYGKIFFADGEEQKLSSLTKAVLRVSADLRMDYGGIHLLHPDLLFRNAKIIEFVSEEFDQQSTAAFDHARANRSMNPMLNPSFVLTQFKDTSKVPRIGLIVGKNNTIIQDFIKGLRPETPSPNIDDLNSYPYASFTVILANILNPLEVAEKIKTASSSGNYDLVFVMRGGDEGSVVSLGSSKEILDAVLSAGIPVITGIGHQNYEFILRKYSDLDCPTPNGCGTWLKSELDKLRMPDNKNNGRGIVYITIISVLVAIFIVAFWYFITHIL